MACSAMNNECLDLPKIQRACEIFPSRVKRLMKMMLIRFCQLSRGSPLSTSMKLIPPLVPVSSLTSPFHVSRAAVGTIICL